MELLLILAIDYTPWRNAREQSDARMELEDEFGMNISADEASQIKTVGRAIEFIAKRMKR